MRGEPEPRLYIVMRADLKMGRGKEIAQAIHAFRFIGPIPRRAIQPETPIICVRADDEAHLRAILAQAIECGHTISTVHDAGLTHNEPGTLTCAAIGPVGGDSPPLLAQAKVY